MKFFPTYLLAILFICLTACGATPPPPSNGAPVPVGPPQPVAAQNQARPAAETGPILYDNIPLQSYIHSSGRFSIQYPANWQLFEQSDGVVFVDPTDRAGYSVYFSQVETELTTERLTNFARQFAQKNFGDQAGFAILSQDGETLNFKGSDANFGPAINRLTLVPADELIYLTLITVVEDQWQQVAADLQKLTDSLEIKPAGEPSPTPPPVPPSWAFYAHPTEKFAFLYPDNWAIAETDQSAQARLPVSDFVFSVESVSKPGAGTDSNLAATFTQEQADELAAQFDDFQSLPLATYQAEGGQGYTIDYLYTDPDRGPIAGSIIVTGIEDKLYLIQITAPALGYEAALAWFNPMLQSFRLVPDDFVTPPPP